MDDNVAVMESRRADPVLRSRASRVAVMTAAVLVAAAIAAHLGMVFLHVAPPNAVSREYAAVINGYVRPEFQQNWKLFAPDPLHVQRNVQARAEVRRPDGSLRVTDWVDLTAVDLENTRGSLAPSHTRNQLGKGWQAVLGSHDGQGRPRNVVGQVVDGMVKRVALRRLSSTIPPSVIQRIQVRARTVAVPPPPWAPARATMAPRYRALPWWPVRADDFPAGTER